MKAIRIKEFGGPEVMKLEEVLDLKPGAGQSAEAARAALLPLPLRTMD